MYEEHTPKMNTSHEMRTSRSAKSPLDRDVASLRERRFWAHFERHPTSPTRWTDSARASWGPVISKASI